MDIVTLALAKKYTDEKCSGSTETTVPTIVENTKIYTLSTGVYNVQGEVKLYYNDNTFYNFYDTKNYILIVGEKNSDGSVPYFACTFYRFNICDQDKGYGTHIIEGISSTGNNGKLDYRNMGAIETTTNKVTSISSSSNNGQYPSAKAVYDFVKNYVDNAIGG